MGTSKKICADAAAEVRSAEEHCDKEDGKTINITEIVWIGKFKENALRSGLAAAGVSRQTRRGAPSLRAAYAAPAAPRR